MFEQFITTIDTLGRNRKITVLLPHNYETSETNYPVIYMHDAQNLFDDSTATGGQSWRVQNYFKLPEHTDSIVVAIDNSEFRLGEYSPFIACDYALELTSHFTLPMAQGIEYVDWITNGLKPLIDKKYRTLSQSRYTAIVGSSMGGLISLYAGITYPDVYGNLGILSPAFWFCKDEMAKYVTSHPLPITTSVYMSVGTVEGGGIAHNEDYLRDAIEFKELLVEQNCSLEFIIISDGIHHESAWEQLTDKWMKFFQLN